MLLENHKQLRKKGDLNSFAICICALAAALDYAPKRFNMKMILAQKRSSEKHTESIKLKLAFERSRTGCNFKSS